MNSGVLERAGIPEASAVDRLCTSNGRGPHSQAILVLRTSTRKKADRMNELRFKDVAKRDKQAIGLPIDSWETLASDRSAWKTNCTDALREGDMKASSHHSAWVPGGNIRRRGPLLLPLIPPMLCFLWSHLPIKNRTSKPSQKMFKELHNY